MSITDLLETKFLLNRQQSFTANLRKAVNASTFMIYFVIV